MSPATHRRFVWVPLYRAARQAGRSPAEMIQLARDGKIYAKLVGGARWFYRHDSLARFVKRHGRGRAA